MHLPEAPAVSEHMIRYVKVRVVDVRKYRALKQRRTVVPEADDHDDVFHRMQRIVLPVASGAAVITVEEMDVV